MPAYNESATIRLCLDRVLAVRLPDGWDTRVIVVNDASTDDTAAILEAMNEDIQIHHHEVNHGKGAALLTGFNLVLDAVSAQPESETTDTHDVVLVQDADLEYNPDEYPALLEPIINHGAEAVYGTRFGSHRRQHSLVESLHESGNRFLTDLSNALTGYRLSDMETCYKMISVPVLKRIRSDLSETGFGIEPQITAALARIGVRIHEVPISYDPRSFKRGKKIKWRDGVRAIWVMLREAIRDGT